MKKAYLIIYLFAATLVGCASAPAPAPLTVGTYCDGQARLVVNRMAAQSAGNSPLSGNADPQIVREYVYKDCVEKAGANSQRMASK